MTEDNPDQDRAALEIFLRSSKILVVESDEKARNRVIHSLVALGSKSEHILFSNDFKDAKEQILLKRPEIVITDFTIPNGSGLELASEFNQIKNYTSIFIILTENSFQS